MSSGRRFRIVAPIAIGLAVMAWTETDPDFSLFAKSNKQVSDSASFQDTSSLSATVSTSPVAWTLLTSPRVVIHPREGYEAEVLDPLRPLYMGNLIDVPEGETVSMLIPANNTRRVFDGPAQLEVIADTVSLKKGPKPKVYPANPEHMKLAMEWVESPSNRNQLKTEAQAALKLIAPLNGAMLLTRDPVFVFSGDLPRDGKLIVYNADGRRFWVQPLENAQVSFPPAADFQWGQSFSWEVRKSTGGRVLSGKFDIASENQALDLLSRRVPNLPETSREDLLFYGIQLELSKAYSEASDVWRALGMTPYK